MILLPPYAPDPTTAARQRATWDALADGARWLRRHCWTVVHWPCRTETDYETGLRRLWGQDDLCLVEHDIVPSPAHWAALAACPHPICAVAYSLAIPTDRTDLMRWAVAVVDQLDPAHRAVAHAHAPIQTARQWLEALDAGQSDTWAHRVRLPADPDAWRWLRTGERWADYWSLGLTRIRRTVQRTVTRWPPGTWRNLDDRLSHACRAAGFRAHVHWPPVPHHH